MVEKICAKCMTGNIADATFCYSCGALLDEHSPRVNQRAESKFIKTFRSRWSIVWILAGIFVVFTILGLSTFLFNDLNELDEFTGLLLSSTAMYGLMLLWVLWLRYKNGLSLNVLLGKLSRLRSIKVHYLILMVLVGMGFSIASTYISIYLLIQLFGEIFWLDKLFDGTDLWPQQFDSLKAYLHTIFVVLLLVLIAPVFEEIVFRGIFMTRWVVKWGYKRGIILSSILFGVLHPGVMGPSVMGIILCLLYIRTKSLWVSVLFHMINNSIVVLLVLITNDRGSINSEEFDSSANILPILILFIVTTSIIAFILYNLRPLKSDIIPYEHNMRNLNNSVDK